MSLSPAAVGEELQQFWSAPFQETAGNDAIGMFAPPSNPAYVCVQKCNGAIFVNIKQFVKNELVPSYAVNTDGVTLTMEDFSALMLQLKSIEQKLAVDNEMIRSVNCLERPKKIMKKSRNS